MLTDVFRTANHALELLPPRAASVAPLLAALGIVLYIVAQAVRPRGWHNIIRAAYPDATGLRPGPPTAASLAARGPTGASPGSPRAPRRPPPGPARASTASSRRAAATSSSSGSSTGASRARATRR